MTTNMAKVEERFQAAVNVIKGLPKNGPYQPSTAMMLKFYGLFKQATEGACEQSKPSFWDIVGKAKWDAWNRNRHLSKEQAMLRYVEGLQEIIETMSFTENVQNFVGSLDGLSNINLDELELVSPGMRELAESHPNSPFHSRTNSPQHGSSSNSNSMNGGVNAEGESVVPEPQSNGHHTTNGYSPLTTETTESNNNKTYANNSSSVAMVDPSDDEYDDPYDFSRELTQAISRNTDLLRQIQSTIQRMNTDISTVQQRVQSVEQTILELRNFQQDRNTRAVKSSPHRHPVWWPFKNISPLWFAVLVLWPFILRRVANLINRQPARHR